MKIWTVLGLGLFISGCQSNEHHPYPPYGSNHLPSEVTVKRDENPLMEEFNNVKKRRAEHQLNQAQHSKRKS